MKHIVIIGSHQISLLNFRGKLIEEFIRLGNKVTVMTPNNDENLTKKIESMGAKFQAYNLNRHSVNPIKGFITIYSLFRIYVNLKPDIIFAYTIKPVIYTGILMFVFTLFPLSSMIKVRVVPSAASSKDI